MKKLIAISVMLVLLTSAVFAQEITVGAVVEVGMKVGNADGSATEAPSKYGFSGVHNVNRFSFSAQNDDGTYGGFLRFDIMSAQAHEVRPSFAYIWWQPIDQVWLFLGKHNDGQFESSGNAAHNFHGGGRIGAVIDAGYGYNGTAFTNSANGNESFNLSATIKPVDMFTLNLSLWMPPGWGSHGAIGTTGNRNGSFENILSHLFAQAVVNVGVGTLYVTFDGDGDNWRNGAAAAPHPGLVNDAGDRTEPMQFGVSFHSTSLVEGLDFGVGFNYAPNDVWVGDDQGGPKGPINFGLYAYYTGGDWGVKARGRMFLGQDDKIAANEGAYFFQADIMPWYNFGAFEARLNIRIQDWKQHKDSTVDAFGFVINPYVLYPIDKGYMSVGFIYESEKYCGIKDGRWRIPIGFAFNF